MVAPRAPRRPYTEIFHGHWWDSLGNSIVVSAPSSASLGDLMAVLSPLIDHPSKPEDTNRKVLAIRQDPPPYWRCGNAHLEWWDEHNERLVWLTDDGRRSIWTRKRGADSTGSECASFPWLLNGSRPETLPLYNVLPWDILHDGARVAAILDIRQMIGPNSEPQERLTTILMDHDLQYEKGGDYLIPSKRSPLWQTLPVQDSVRRNILQRIRRIPFDAWMHRISWNGDEIWVGLHKIPARKRDIRTLECRWVGSQKDERKPLEIARLLALYSIFDNPLSHRRSGVHLGLEPAIRQQCDFELFASPLNAAVPNGRFASKWPHIEWRFGSIGTYPSVLHTFPADSIVCVNPPFTEAYLADVMMRLAELKLRFRLRLAVPIREAPWRKKLQTALPSAQLLRTYYDATDDQPIELKNSTLFWEDPRAPPVRQVDDTSASEDESTSARSEPRGDVESPASVDGASENEVVNPPSNTSGPEET